MKFGIAYPNLIEGAQIQRLAVRAEELGFESLWAGDHIVLPVGGTTQYPYSEDGTFQFPSEVPFLEPLTLLGYVASCTSRIRIGTTVIIVPYRHPVVQAKMFATLDVLTGGRMVCGVGVGWLEKEFETLGAPYAERGALTDECLAVFACLWREKRPAFHGRFFAFDGITFEPKPVQQPRIPIWVGGHSRRAIRRAVEHGDAWHPTRQTPEFVAGMLPYLRACCEARGRDPGEITVSLKRSLHFTDIDLAEEGNPQAAGVMRGTTREVLDDARRCQDLGIHQLTYDFRTADADACIRVMENLAEKVASRLD